MMFDDQIINLLFIFTRKKVQMLHKLLIGVVGIYGAYLTMSLVSEKMYNTEYAPAYQGLPPGKFKYPPLLVWLGGLLCAIAGKIISIIKKEPANPISQKERIIMGCLFTVNMVTSSYALLYIAYPIQVIGRNIRFLFVVIIGAYFSRIKKLDSHLKLGKHKIYIAAIITIGVLLFNFAKESKKDKADKHNPQLEWIGYLLLTVSVIADALFSDSQAYSKAMFKPTSNQLFTITNFYSFIISLLFSVFVDGTFLPSIKFLMNYPSAFIDLIVVGVLQVLGQISIYYIVANFKQHIFPLISTTRKILTVILSIFVYNHYANTTQWIAIGFVFFGMFYEFYEELMHQKKKDESELNVQVQANNANSINSSSEEEEGESKQHKQ